MQGIDAAWRGGEISGLSEDDVIKHVQKYCFHDQGQYMVSFQNKGYFASETRGLVLQICQDHNVQVK